MLFRSDHTDSDLLGTFGTVREEFFTGLSSLVVDDGERQRFLQTYLNAPSLAAFRRNETEQIQRCFIKLPRESKGRYVQIKMNMVTTPDSGDVTGILTVTDVTEQTVSDRILYQMSVSGNEFVVDLDLTRDSYTVISCSKHDGCLPPRSGCHSQWVKRMLSARVVPRDREASVSYTHLFPCRGHDGRVYGGRVPVLFCQPADAALSWV